MKTFGRAIVVVALLSVLNLAMAGESVKFSEEIYHQFDNEEIKPYLKIMRGIWVPSTIQGEPGDYRITALMPPGSEYIIGLFDHKVGRQGDEERSALILVDGVNPLNPKEHVAVEEIDSTDVSQFRKYPLNGLSYNATDNAGKNCVMLVVDAKEEYEFGPVQPIAVPADRTGRVLGYIHVLIYQGPAMSPVPGQKVDYGKPIRKFSFTLQNDGGAGRKPRPAAAAAGEAAEKPEQAEVAEKTPPAPPSAPAPAAAAAKEKPPARRQVGESVRVGKPVRVDDE